MTQNNLDDVNIKSLLKKRFEMIDNMEFVDQIRDGFDFHTSTMICQASYKKLADELKEIDKFLRQIIQDDFS